MTIFCETNFDHVLIDVHLALDPFLIISRTTFFLVIVIGILTSIARYRVVIFLQENRDGELAAACAENLLEGLLGGGI